MITALARAAMDELGVTDDQVTALGIPVIRRTDVEQLATANAAPAAPLSKVQQAVGRAVTLSHATIPAAYAVLDMALDEELAATRRLTKQVRRPVGLPELFVMAVARLHARNSRCSSPPSARTAPGPSFGEAECRRDLRHRRRPVRPGRPRRRREIPAGGWPPS